MKNSTLCTPTPSLLKETPDFSLQELLSVLTFPSKEWSNYSLADLTKLQICKIPEVAGSSLGPLRIAFSITVNGDLSWSLFVCQHKVTEATCNLSLLY